MMNTINNVELEMETAKRVTRKTHYINNDDSSVTIKVTDGYDHILREETFTREDMITLADRYTNKLVDKDTKKKRRDSCNEILKTLMYVVGVYTCSIGGALAGQKLFFKLMNKIRK